MSRNHRNKKYQDENEDFQLTKIQRKALIEFANIGHKDVFYDLGSADGKVVLDIVKQTNVKKAIGIESSKIHHNKAKRSVLCQLPKKDLRRIDFWLGEFGEGGCGCYDYDISDATIVYNSLNEERSEINYYRDQFKSKQIKIIKKDLPLVGFWSIPYCKNRNCWFFLIPFPLKRIQGKNKWAISVLGQNNVTIDNVYEYYNQQLKKRKTFDKERRESVRDLNKLVKSRF